jgi:gluconolactonase
MPLMGLAMTAITLGTLSTVTLAPMPSGYELAVSIDGTEGSLERVEARPSSEWNLADGRLNITAIGTQGAVRSPFSYVTLPGYWVGDLVLTFRARCHTAPEVMGRDVCAIFGWSDDMHYTYVHFSNFTDAIHNAILKVDGADRAPLPPAAEPRAELTGAGWHSFRVERTMADGMIRGYVDNSDTPCLVARDPEPWAGRVGLGSFDDLASFDDIRLYVRTDRTTLDDILAPGAQVRQLATGFVFTEGPSWDAREGLLKFSDIPSNRINTLTPEGEVGVFVEPSEQTNGTFYDARDGSLLGCRHWARDVVRYAPGGVATVLADTYRGGKFNSPNDCVLTPTGAIFFTDPAYGLGDRPSEQSVEAVYRLDPSGEVSRVIDDMTKPNGIYISPDGRWLYVADSIDQTIKAYRVGADGSCSDGRVLGELRAEEEGVPDGMTMDTHGRIYCTGSGGVWVFGPQGELIGRILVPEPPANCTFGGRHLSTLYMTARSSVYAVETRATGFMPPVTASGAE